MLLTVLLPVEENGKVNSTGMSIMEKQQRQQQIITRKLLLASTREISVITTRLSVSLAQSKTDLTQGLRLNSQAL